MKTTLSVKDFVIIYNCLDSMLYKLSTIEEHNGFITKLSEDQLKENRYYIDVKNVMNKLGELNFDVETPNVEIGDK